jgi:hypothetical protein
MHDLYIAEIPAETEHTIEIQTRRQAQPPRHLQSHNIYACASSPNRIELCHPVVKKPEDEAQDEVSISDTILIGDTDLTVV